MLSRQAMMKIEEIIDTITTQTCMMAPYNTALEITKELGLQVYFIDFGEQFYKLKGIVDYKNKKIFLNKAIPIANKSFMLAKCVGHYVLHEPKIRGRFYLVQ